MDKAQFIEIAPVYYALAIAAFMRARTGATSKSEIEEEYSHVDPDSRETWYDLPNDRLFERAITWLEKEGLIVVEPDEFGPPLLEQSGDFHAAFDRLCDGGSPPFSRYARHRYSNSWLRETLAGVTRREVELRITDADFDTPDRDWEPIPLDRDDPTLSKAITALDTAIEQVRADNGYAATYPEERELAVTGLSALTQRLKTAASVSFAYVRETGIENLRRLWRRFRGAALEIVIAAARESLKEWLRRRGITYLDDWFR